MSVLYKPTSVLELTKKTIANFGTHFETMRAFHDFWYESGTTWQSLTWRGVHVMKNPMDLWIYAELIQQIHPALVIETGTAHGGSARWFADCGAGHVVTIDTDPMREVDHPNITQLIGSSTDPAIVAQAAAFIRGDGPVLVSLDSDHSTAHVAAELALYAPLVTVGSVMVVEDTNVAEGPLEALQPWLAAHAGTWAVDAMCHRLYLTFNPGGWLRRLA